MNFSSVASAAISLALPTMVAAEQARLDLKACLQARFKVELTAIEHDRYGSTLVYEAKNDLGWSVSATQLALAFEGKRRFQRELAVFPVVGDLIAAGETRVVWTKFWGDLPETLRAEDVEVTLVDVFDADRKFLTGDGSRVHKWPNTRTNKDCTQ